MNKIQGVQMRPGPDLRIILIITGINQYPLQDLKHTRMYSCAQISMTDAGLRWYRWHQTMPDDGGPRGSMSALAQPIIKSHGKFFLRGTKPRR